MFRSIGQATMEVNLAASPIPGPCGGASTANVGVELRATRYDEVSSGYIDGNVEWVCASSGLKHPSKETN
jgi:hypothetical protein